MRITHVLFQRMPFAVEEELINTETGDTLNALATGLKLTVVGEDGTTMEDYWTMEQFAAMCEGVLKNVVWDA